MAWSPTLLVFAGGGAGAVARHAVNRLGLALLGPGFPWWTLAVNVAGSFAMGVCVGAFVSDLSQSMRLFLTTGLLGGFTTFSAFSLDTIVLYQRGEVAAAAAYAGASVLLSLAALMLGLALTR